MTNQANTSNQGPAERQQPRNADNVNVSGTIAATLPSLSSAPNTPTPTQETEPYSPPTTDVSAGDHEYPSLVEGSSVVVTSDTDVSVQDPSTVVTPSEINRGLSGTVSSSRMLYRRGSSLTPPRLRPSQIGGRRFSLTPPRMSSPLWTSGRGSSFSVTRPEATLPLIGRSPLTPTIQGLHMVVGGSITVEGGGASAPPALPPQPVKRGPGPICSVCHRHFFSWKALFGHLRCHPERAWRGCFPPPVREAPQADQQPPPQGEFDLNELAQSSPPPPPPAAGANEGDDRFDLNMPPPNEDDNEGTPGPAAT